VGRRILVIEDHDENRRILRDLLRSGGYGIIEATTGPEGVRMAEQERPDLIVMDIQLPGIDGYEATRRIKANPTLQQIPIICSDLVRAKRRRRPGAEGRLRRIRRKAVQPARTLG
jgi:two-component system, cell cycle response regulator DivK